MRKAISVIVPVYNGEEHIERCLDSIINQTSIKKDQIELLVVNDGSTDKSAPIIQTYVDRFPDVIKLINQKNAGAAQARNRGIVDASGEYLVFVDQDDWLDTDFLSTMYAAARESGADVVAGGYRRPNSHGVVEKEFSPKDSGYSKYILMAAWAKIHRTEFIKKHDCHFFSNTYGEDTIFTLKEIRRRARWIQVSYVGYNWYQNPISVSNTIQKGLQPSDVASIKILLNEIKRVGPVDDEVHYFQFFILRTVVGYLLFSGRNATQTNFVAAYKSLFKWIKEQSHESLKARCVLNIPRGETAIGHLAISGFWLLHRLKLVRVFAFFYCR